jgi:hypothetical protein
MPNKKDKTYFIRNISNMKKYMKDNNLDMLDFMKNYGQGYIIDGGKDGTIPKERLKEFLKSKGILSVI